MARWSLVVVLWYSAALKAGATTTWTNFDATLHKVAITRGPVRSSSPAFNKGGIYSAACEKPGVYRYLCTFHPETMSGRITVRP